MTVRMPAWLDDLPEAEKAEARAKFLLKLAALYHSPEGHLKVLSKDLKLHPSSLAQLNSISTSLAIRLEQVCGREHFPRELFRPDIFLVQE